MKFQFASLKSIGILLILSTLTIYLLSCGGGAGGNKLGGGNPAPNQTPTFGGIISAQPIDMGSIKLTWGPLGGSLGGIPPNQLVFSICYSINPNICLTQFVPITVNPPASVDSNGNYVYTVKPLKPGTTYYFVVRVQDPVGNRDSNTAVAAATTKSGKLYVSDFTNNQILRFDHPSLLNQNPPIAESIQAAPTISGPTGIFLNNSRDINGIQKDRLNIANYSNNSIVVLDGASSVSGNANSAITKIITSSALQNPFGIYVDTSQSREWIYVENSTKDSTGMFAVLALDISLCPTNTVSCNMDAVPNGMRIIHSNDFDRPDGIWVDEGLDSFNQPRDILFVSNRGLANSSSPGFITLFSNSSTLTGSVSATKIILGNMTSLLGPAGLFMDSLKDQLYITNQGYNDILVFNQPQNCSGSQVPNICNVLPDRTIYNVLDINHLLDGPSSLAIDFSGDQLYLANLGLYNKFSSLMVLNQASKINGQATISSYVSSASLTNASYILGYPESIALDSTR